MINQENLLKLKAVVHKIIDKDLIEKNQYLTLMEAYLENIKIKKVKHSLLEKVIEDFYILNKGKKV